MFICNICGRDSKNRVVIDNCKHTRLKKQKALENDIAIEPICSDEILLENIEGKTIRKVYHCSDIHIRLNSQHDQYQIVFNNFYNMLRKSEKGVVVCCGDILHNKNELSPECIVLVLDFLESLAQIMPTFIIAGNHDAVLNNTDKLDSLSGILDRRMISDLYYLKNSGVYRYNNILFGVSSLLDSKFISADTILKSDGNISIGLYHGSVGSPINDMGYKISGEKQLSQFKGYDLVLLGDIHKFQYLDEYKTVAYSSSLISQNFGECDEYHGYLEWDLSDKSSIYRIVPNDYRYVRIIFDNQRVLDIPSNCYLQVSLSQCKEKTDKEYLENLIIFKNLLKTEYPYVRVNYIYGDTVESKTIHNKLENLTENMLVYISKRYPNILSEDIEWIMKNIDWNPSVVSENIQWSLLYMEWDYMCKYGPNNRIDFRKLSTNAINGLIAPNSSGKSTFIDIITFLLFSQMNRVISNRKHIQPDIINVKQNKCSGVIYFSTSKNDIYIIEKSVSRIKDNNSKIKLSSNFYRLYENVSGDYEWDGRKFVRECLTGKDRKETDKNVSEIIGTYDDFVFHSLFLQSDNLSFRKMAPMERKDFMYRLFSLDFLTRQHFNTKENLKKSRNTLDILKKSLENIDIGLLESSKTCIQNELIILNDTVNSNETERSLLNDKRLELYKGLWPISKPLSIDENRLNILRLEYLDNVLDDNRDFKYVVRRDEIIRENMLFLKDRDIRCEIILNKIMECNRLKENVAVIEDFNRDRLGELCTRVFPDNLRDRISDLRGRLVNRVIIKSPDHTREECNQLLLSIDEAMVKIDIVKRIIEYDDSVVDRYNSYLDIVSTNNRIKNTISMIESGIEQIEYNYEYNPDCDVCIKNPKTVQLFAMREELLELRGSIQIVDNSIIDEYEQYKKIKSANDAEEKRIESNIKTLTELRIQKFELLDESELINKYEEYLSLEKYREEYERLLVLEGEFSEYTVLIEYEKSYNENILVCDRNKILDIEIDRLMLERQTLMTSTCLNYDKLTVEIQEYNEYNSQKDSASLERIKVSDEIELYKKSLLNDEIRLELISLESRLKCLENMDTRKIQELQRDYGEIIGRMAMYETTLKSIGDSTIELRRYEYLESILSVNGFSLYLLENNLANISNGVSEILAPMIGVSLKLCIDNNDLVMYSYRVDSDIEREVRLDTFGGMEQFMLDWSFRVLSLRYTMLPRCDLFILDETFSCFDNNNLGKIGVIYELLYSLYDHIIMITHLDKLKDTIHNMINISVSDGYARMSLK